MKKLLKRTLIILIVLVIISVVQYTPAVFLKTPDMNVKEGKYVLVYYQKGDDKGAPSPFY